MGEHRLQIRRPEFRHDQLACHLSSTKLDLALNKIKSSIFLWLNEK
jgi:hypothetical protein